MQHNLKKTGKKKRSVFKKYGRYLRLTAGILLILAGLISAYFAYRRFPLISAYPLIASAVLCMATGMLYALAKHKKGVVLFLTVLALGTGCVFASGYLTGYRVLEGKLTAVETYSYTVTDHIPEDLNELPNLTMLDMRGSTVTDFSALTSLTNLKYIDARDNHAFTQQDYDTLKAALPDCRILWSMPVAGTYFENDSAVLDLSGFDLSVSEIQAAQSEYPDRMILYTVPLLGEHYTADTEVLELQNASGFTEQALTEALTLLPNVSKIDLTGVDVTRETVDTLRSSHPGIEFKFTFSVGGQLLSEDVTSLTFGKDSYEDILACASYYDQTPALTMLNLKDADLSLEQIDAVRAAYPETVNLNFSFRIYGKKVNSLDSEIDLSGVKMGNTDDLKKVMPYMPNLKKVNLLDTGLSTEKLEDVADSREDILFVFRIKFGHWTLRTDADAFSTRLYARNPYHYTSATFAPIRFCRNLKYLDLGHNHITDISFIKPLKELRVLILARNSISDISPLSEIHKLEYVELFSNKIRDFSPLASSPNIMDLNICRNKIYDSCFDTFLQFPKMRRFWAGMCSLSTSQVNKLKEAYPNAKIDAGDLVGRNPTRNWRGDDAHFMVIHNMNADKKYYPFEESVVYDDEK